MIQIAALSFPFGERVFGDGESVDRRYQALLDR